jgi:hypothetical protein
MTIRVCPPAALLAVGLALAGCVDVECPAEFDRPLSRERYCGHTGDVATPTTYYTAPNARPLPPSAYTPVQAPIMPGQPMQQPATVAPMPPPLAPRPIQ